MVLEIRADQMLIMPLASAKNTTTCNRICGLSMIQSGNRIACQIEATGNHAVPLISVFFRVKSRLKDCNRLSTGCDLQIHGTFFIALRILRMESWKEEGEQNRTVSTVASKAQTHFWAILHV